MLRHFLWNGTVWKDMSVVLSAIQLASDVCEPILEDVQTNMSYIDIG